MAGSEKVQSNVGIFEFMNTDDTLFRDAVGIVLHVVVAVGIRRLVIVHCMY